MAGLSKLLPARDRRRRRGTVAVTAIALAAALLMPQTLAAKAVPGIFGSVESHRKGLKPFPKWTGALQKYFDERKAVKGGCEEPKFNRCHYGEWQKFIDSLNGKKLKTQLNAVNKFMNTHKYIVDPVNWGVKDYWETPGEFFEKYGDCEDYAVAKYLTLRRLGVDPETMRVVVVMDQNLKIPHAILAVYANNKTLVLDNQLSIVVESRRIRHYKPIYSVNESGWWKHKVKRKKKRRK